MKHYEGKFKSAGNISLFFQKWIPDQVPIAVIVIAHGIGEHSGRYMTIVNHFVPPGYAIYALDHRGHGRSPGKRGHIMRWEIFREDLKHFVQFVRSEQGDKPLYLLGHSLGGLMVLDFALHYPHGLNGVIASSPALAEPNISPALILLSKIMSYVWPALTIKTTLDVTAISHDPAVIEAYQGDPLVHDRGSARLGTEFGLCRKWTLDHAGEFSCPLLIYHGRSDRIVPYQGSVEFFESVNAPDKELHLFDNGFHELHHDSDKENLFLLIENWLHKHREG